MISEKIELHTGAYFNTYIMDSEIKFKQYRKRPALIICPGGAYAIHAVREGEPVAINFMQMGYQCFVLKYSVGTDRLNPEKGLIKEARYPIQVLELLETIHLIKSHSEEWQIDSERIFMMGFSAGGHVCASAGLRWDDPELVKQLSFKPYDQELKTKGIVLGYPFLSPNSESFLESHRQPGSEAVEDILNYVLYQKRKPEGDDADKVDLINYVSEKAVPVFIWHSIDDPVVESSHTLAFVSKMLEINIPVELHFFSHGEHGKSLENTLTNFDDSQIDSYLNTWVELANQWMIERGRK